MSYPLPVASIVRPGERLSWEFTLLLRRDEDGPPVRRVRVTETDLVDPLAELWRDAFLRRGFPAAPFEDVVFSLTPRLRGAGPRCEGFTLEVENPRGERFREEHSIDAFRDTALHAAQDLLGEDDIEKETVVYYEVRAHRREESVHPDGVRSLRATPRSAALSFLSVPLEPLLDRSRAAGDGENGSFPVIYTEEALSKAERFARQGGKLDPPVETGCALIGWLCSCPDSGEFFPVVCDALEARDAEERKFSLAYTSKTWTRLQAVIAARRKGEGGRALRILGQGHGHSFPPAGPPCAACPTAAVCGKTTVFVSTSDRLWSRVVFHRQPWHLSHIFGLNARGEAVAGLFTLQGNRLAERGFHVIPDSSGIAGASGAPEVRRRNVYSE